MKKLIFLIFSSLIITSVNAQKQISIEEASKYLNQKVIVCDSVFGIKILPSLTFVNVAGDYPNQKLTLVFYKKDIVVKNLDVTALCLNKRICITGKLIKFEGNPQIVIKNKRQITLYN